MKKYLTLILIAGAVILAGCTPKQDTTTCKQDASSHSCPVKGPVEQPAPAAQVDPMLNPAPAGVNQTPTPAPRSKTVMVDPTNPEHGMGGGGAGPSQATCWDGSRPGSAGCPTSPSPTAS